MICSVVIKGDRAMPLMSLAVYHSSLFWELSHMEEFRNKRNIENRCALCVRNPLSLQIIMLECNMI